MTRFLLRTIRRDTLLLSSLAWLAAAATAQGRHVTPLHAVGLEGNSSSGISFTNARTRTQQIDSNFVGTSVTLFQGMAFRRTNSAFRTGSVARDVDVTIDLGRPAAKLIDEFDANFQSGSRRTVFSSRVRLPDWRGSATRPADFDLQFPFSSSFLHDNTQPLIWDLRTENGSGGGEYLMDWFSVTPQTTRGELGKVLASGCGLHGGAFSYTAEFRASRTELFYDWSVSKGPLGALAVPVLGFQDPNAPTAWCGRLRSDAVLLLPTVALDATGAASGTVKVPWTAALRGIPLFAQAGSFDSNSQGGIALSAGVATSTPFIRAGGGNVTFNILRVISDTSHGPLGSGPFPTAVPVLWSTN